MKRRRRRRRRWGQTDPPPAYLRECSDVLVIIADHGDIGLVAVRARTIHAPPLFAAAHLLKYPLRPDEPGVQLALRFAAERKRHDDEERRRQTGR